MDKKILRWNFIFQYGWVLTNIFNSILLLPIYLHRIDADTLGLWLATGNILGWMLLVDPGVGEVLQQKIAELRGSRQAGEIGKMIGSGIVCSIVILFLSLIIGMICYSFVGLIIKKDIQAYPHLSAALVVSVLATGMSLVSFSLSGINQGLHNAANVAIASLTANFVFLGLNIWFLYLGYGVLSIALANLCRALFINFFNAVSLRRVVRQSEINVVYNRAHFKRFVKIFSFTSASKIVTGLSYSIEMVVLARYISPSLITIYEINKRPVNITYSLIGRHSVALMPSISHAKGSGDSEAILQLLRRQFRFYAYASLFAALAFYFNYENLITVWTGKGKYAGNFIIGLMVAGLFFNLISYFMATIGYALGDIKMNSLYNIIRNIIFGALIFFAAKIYGIPGTLSVSLLTALLADLFFYAWRLRQLGYLEKTFFLSLSRLWILILPAAIAGGWLCRWMVLHFIPSEMYFAKLMAGGGLFVLYFLVLVMSFDRQMRKGLIQICSRYLFPPLSRFTKA